MLKLILLALVCAVVLGVGLTRLFYLVADIPWKADEPKMSRPANEEDPAHSQWEEVR